MSQRLNGWKAISAHFQRDRSTIMRWARVRGMPVRRVPGGKQATVYAFTDELDRWAGSAGVLEPVDGMAAEAPAPRPSHRARMAIGAMLAVAALAGAGAMAVRYRIAADPAPAMNSGFEQPKSQELATLYLRARGEWSDRTPESLGRAISQFRLLTRMDPGFAPGHVGLAESYFLAREFGGLADKEAFGEAERAIDTALRLEPDLASAHRARGFIRYWWHGDAPGAGKAFRKALKLAPGDPQTNYWYANVLSDNGQPELALGYFAKALAIQPGRTEVMVDYAWAQWEAGADDAADNILRDIEDAAANSAVYHEVLRDTRLTRGDWQGSVEAFENHARLRGKPKLIEEARALREAAAKGDQAIAATAFAYALDKAEHEPGSDHAWAATIASTSGDRGQLIAILQKALDRGERWGSAGYKRRIANRWQGDPEVIDLLSRLRRPPAQ